MNHETLMHIEINPDSPSDWADIYHCQPAHEFVYIFRNKSDEVLYVGVTWSAKQRWNNHRRKKPWWREVAKAEVLCFSKDHEALAHERNLIKRMKPKYNIRSAKK